jgi:hypothetical protein
MGDGHVSIDPTLVWSDCCAFDDAVRRAERAHAEGRTEELNRALQEARDLYQGEFLSDLGDEPWIVKRRNDLRQKAAWVKAQAADRDSHFFPPAPGGNFGSLISPILVVCLS